MIFHGELLVITRGYSVFPNASGIIGSFHRGFVAAPLNSQMLPKTNWAEDGSSTKCWAQAMVCYQMVCYQMGRNNNVRIISVTCWKWWSNSQMMVNSPEFNAGLPVYPPAIEPGQAESIFKRWKIIDQPGSLGAFCGQAGLPDGSKGCVSRN